MMDYRDDPFLWDEYCDMVHEFTITEPMVVTMDDEGSDNFGENDYRSVLMSSRTDTVQAVISEMWTFVFHLRLFYLFVWKGSEES